jgi:hypothetical protein
MARTTRRPAGQFIEMLDHFAAKRSPAYDDRFVHPYRLPKARFTLNPDGSLNWSCHIPNTNDQMELIYSPPVIDICDSY